MRSPTSLLLLALLAPAAAAADREWAEGVPYTTDWDDAIAEAKSTGRILFVYNGWERPDI